jgi:hypothetical protein
MNFLRITLARDFNLVLKSKEKRGGNIVGESFGEKMEDLMMDWDIVDIK